MKPPRICIICREYKTSFSREHVFPEAIGGDWVIHSVCAGCNTWLGRYIDEPFVNSPSISIERVVRKISRGGRRIKNPLAKKTFLSPDGKKYAVDFTKDGRLQAQFLPHTFIDYSSEIPIGKISYPTEWVAKNPEGLEKLKQKFIREFEQETGRKIESVVPDVLVPADPLQVMVTERGNDIIFGCLKIAYEATVTIIPRYLEDPLAIVYANMLKTAKPDRSYLSYFNPDAGFIDSVKELLTHFPVTAIYQLGAVIFNVPTIGLVCAVRAFGIFYPIVMSTRIDYMDNRMVILLNDSIRSKAWYMVFKSPVRLTLLIEEDALTAEQEEELALMKSQGLNHFEDEAGRTPLFDATGKQIASDAHEMVSLYNLTHNCPAATITQWMIDARANRYYALSRKSNTYFKLHTIVFDWTTVET